MIPQKIGSILFDTVLDDQNQLPGEFNQGFPAVINSKKCKQTFVQKTNRKTLHPYKKAKIQLKLRACC